VPCETCGQPECICADLAVAVQERPQLFPGDQMRCKRCGQWHVVFAATETTNPRMLWFKCPRAEGVFYAGSFGLWLLPDEIARWRPGPPIAPIS
jgi:hypothetical protein